MLPVWVHFPQLPVEFYTEAWLHKAGDEIGKTIKVNDTTLATIQGRFVRVCVEIDMGKPLKSTYKMRGKDRCLQYEGLHALCFKCSKYGHQEVACPIKRVEGEEHVQIEKGNEASSSNTLPAMHQFDGKDSRFGP